VQTSNSQKRHKRVDVVKTVTYPFYWKFESTGARMTWYFRQMLRKLWKNCGARDCHFLSPRSLRLRHTRRPIHQSTR